MHNITFIKGWVCNKKKNVIENWVGGRVPKQSCSQSAVRGVSTHDVEERAFSEQPSDRKIEMAENKRGKRLRNDKARSRTRVNIGSAFQRESTQGAEGLWLDAEAALVLFDRWVTLKFAYIERDNTTVENHLNLCQHIINRKRQQFSVGDLSRCAASSVDMV